MLVAATAAAQQGDRSVEDHEDLPAGLVVPPADVLAPATAATAVVLQPGFALELVAAEPLIGDPVAAVFDPAGRLWVVEMRSYMRDVDGTDEQAADSRIVVLEDRDGDGRMDVAAPFLEHLVLPRAVLPLAGGALVIAPPQLLWAEDRDGDLRAERTVPIADGFGAGLVNPEHCGNGLLWGLDDRIHIADDARMVRWLPGGGALPFAIEQGAGGGQWGISQDDRGRLYFNYNEDWLRCDLVPGRYAARHGEGAPFAGHNHRVVGDPRIWPIGVTPGVNRGGYDGILADGALVRHTAACAPLVYRGSSLSGCNGDVFVCDPAAHVVRRIRLADQDGRMQGANVYERAEFFAARDERCRPVNLCQGPDGALYIVDMYRGVIQHRNFVTTFLRKQILARGLERPIGLGRIWRVVDRERGREPPRLLATCSTDQLVARLADEDGWQRDAAQRLLVQRQDRGAVPGLRQLLRTAAFAPARVHSLAALRSLGGLDRGDVRRALHDGDAGVLAFALGLAAPLLVANDAVIWSQCEQLAQTAPASVRWQLALTLGDAMVERPARALAVLAGVAASGPADPVLTACVLDSVFGQESAFVRAFATDTAPPDGAGLLRTLARAVAQRREAAATGTLLQQAGACMQAWQQVALLQGLLDAVPAPGAGPSEAPRGFFAFAVTPPALLAMARTGHPDVAPLVQGILARTELRVDVGAIPAAPGDDDLTAPQRAQVAAGGRVFSAFCAACHQPNGAGMPGLAPPLRGSAWVEGSPERLIRIALHGLRGPLTAAGTAFSGEMPGQAHLGDPDLAAALSWLRRSLGHRASIVDAAAVAAVRQQFAARTSPWSTAELALDASGR